MNISKDSDDLHGDDIIAYLRIAVRRNESMSVDGCIEHREFSLAMLDRAKDAVNNFHERQKINNGGLIIPGYDSGIKV